MKQFSNPYQLREALQPLKENNHHQIGFVPTMGALHAGHLALVKKSLSENSATVVSIFVNPSQFSPHEDYQQYPRPLSKDVEQLEKLNVPYLFVPTKLDMYPRTLRNTTRIYLPTLSKLLCGKSRPNHFKGVCMVILRMLNLISPDRAYFGEKDYQQYLILKTMASDLFLHTHILSHPIVREANGLALSSRNAYLSAKEHKEATFIFKTLSLGKSIFDSGQTDAEPLLSDMKKLISQNGSIKLDYLKIVDPITLQDKKHVQSRDRVMFAGFIGKTRLIDNIAL